MQIYADPITVNCRKVLAGLQLMGAPYELVHVDYFKAEQKSDDYVALNPMSSLPALKDGDFVLWESNAILQYAADKFNASAHYPTTSKPAPTSTAGCFGSRQAGSRAAICFWLKTVSNHCSAVPRTRPSWMRKWPHSTNSPVFWTSAFNPTSGSLEPPSPRLLTLPLQRRCICMDGNNCPCPATPTFAAGCLKILRSYPVGKIHGLAKASLPRKQVHDRFRRSESQYELFGRQRSTDRLLLL